jgi:hypothetical protein
MPGSYNIIIRANGYEEQTHQVEVTGGSKTFLNASLVPMDNFYVEQVTLCRFYDPYSWPDNYQNNPTEGVSALGPSDDICASLGKGGYIVLDMGEEGIIIDHENAVDLKIYEGGGSDDSYNVYVSSNWSGPWNYLGIGTGTTEFDLNDFSVDKAQYVKIVDDNDGDPYETNPCADIDAIQHIIPFINNPPNIIEIEGPSTGKPGFEYEYTFLTTDPEDDDVSYYIKWGDGNITKWTSFQTSGPPGYIENHSWDIQGNYVIKAKAKDSYGYESDWSTFKVTMPKNKQYKFNLLNSMIERFSDINKIFRYISEYLLGYHNLRR